MAIGENAKQDLIVIKRSDDVEEKRKGGVWKIAHADFMTAMMAFFLIMWLVNATDAEMKRSIANYFNPLNLVQSPSAQPGLEEPDPDAPPDAGGVSEGASTGSPTAGGPTSGESSQSGGGNVDEGNQNLMASAGIRQETDAAAFHDPYAVLASAAADLDPEDPVAVDVPQSTLGETARTRLSDSPRDPFDPAYWQNESRRISLSLRPGAPSSDTADAVANAAERRSTGPQDTPAAEPAEGVEADTEVASAGSAPNSATNSATNSPMDTEAPGELSATLAGSAAPAAPAAPQRVGPQSALAAAILGELAPQEADDLPVDAQTVAAVAPPTETRDAGAIDNDAAAAAPRTPQQDAAEAAAALAEALQGVTAEVAVAEGARAVEISLMDDESFSMFAIGSSRPTDRARDLFRTVAGVLGTRDGRIVVRGHTDARPFASGSSDNWVLSFQRAHAAKQALVSAGVAEARMARVEGLADRDPFVPDDPLADSNRRIEILYEPVGAPL